MSDTKRTEKVAQRGLKATIEGNPQSYTLTILELTSYFDMTRHLIRKLKVTHPEACMLLMMYRCWVVHGIGMTVSEATKSYGLHGSNLAPVRERINRMSRLGYLQVCGSKKNGRGTYSIWGPTDKLVSMLHKVVVTVPVGYEPEKVKAVRKRKEKEYAECDF